MTDINNQLTSSMFYDKVINKETFVLNVVANWCSDCINQKKNMHVLIDEMAAIKIDVFDLVAQQNKAQFIDVATENLIESLGGHGYPRTVLIKLGKITNKHNVEVISEDALLTLAEKFTRSL